jgi:hypothetical protein
MDSSTHLNTCPARVKRTCGQTPLAATAGHAHCQRQQCHPVVTPTVPCCQKQCDRQSSLMVIAGPQIKATSRLGPQMERCTMPSCSEYLIGILPAAEKKMPTNRLMPTGQEIMDLHGQPQLRCNGLLRRRPPQARNWDIFESELCGEHRGRPRLIQCGERFDRELRR